MLNLYFCKDGKLFPRDPEKNIEVKPKIISYNHTIRKIYDTQCSCKQEITSLKQQFKLQLSEKDNQIQNLINRIAQKQTQLDGLQKEIISLRNSDTPKSKESVFCQNQFSSWGKIEKSFNSTAISSFSLFDFSSSQYPQTARSQLISQTNMQMQDCFNKTNLLMNQIEGIMKKKRKYQFHNPIKVQNSIIQELQNSLQNQKQDAQDMEDTFCVPHLEFNEQEDSFEMTNYDSDRNFTSNQNDNDFYDKLLNDSISLKHTILQMKEESMKQIKQIEDHYQKQLRISYEELQKQRQKNNLFQMTKNKLDQMSQKGRKALTQIDLNENQSWDVGEMLNKNKQSFNKMQISDPINL